MKKWKERWKELLPYEKKFEVASSIFLCLSIIVFIFEILDKLGVLPVAIDMFIISKGMLVGGQICQTVVLWREERHLAHIFMMAAICYGLGIVRDIVKLYI